VVLINNVQAPILFASDRQINAVIPFGTHDQVGLQVQYAGVSSNLVTLPLQQSGPAIFTISGTGQGQGATLNQDSTPNGPENPAGRGSVIQVFATGGGNTNGASIDGLLVGRPSKLSLPVAAWIGGQAAVVTYAGAAPGQVAGLDQVNIRIPVGAPVGSAVSLAIKVGNATSQQNVTVAVR